MKDLNKQPWYTSVVAIVVAMICFWPAGCVMLYLRLIKKDNKYKTISKVLLIASISLLFVGIVGMSSFIESHNSEDLFIALFMFIIPGGICGYFWSKRNEKIRVYNKYLEYINVRKKIKIDGLCNKLNVDYDTATTTLTEMINIGMINGYLEDDEIIIKDNAGNIAIENRTFEKKESKVVKCKECGAKNTIVIGEKNECEYCGSLLQ